MRIRNRAAVLIAGILSLTLPATASADETDNFTCRQRSLSDSQAALDRWVNARIADAVRRANERGGGCNAACLREEFERRVGETVRHPLTLIPHSRLGRWIGTQKDIDRCRLRFSESIYGARAYNQPWLFPFTGRIILLADSIRLSGRVIGTDKINHFIREGLAHWGEVNRDGREIAAVVDREVGATRSPLRFTEYGLKGMALTGVLAYADLAASYSGFTFWSDLLSIGRPQSYVTYDGSTRRYTQRRVFTFADYVNDAWDEAINCSAFDPTLTRQVADALARRGLTCPAGDWRRLGALPGAKLFVNPALAETATSPRTDRPAAAAASDWPGRSASTTTPHGSSRRIRAANPW